MERLFHQIAVMLVSTSLGILVFSGWFASNDNNPVANSSRDITGMMTNLSQ